MINIHGWFGLIFALNSLFKILYVVFSSFHLLDKSIMRWPAICEMNFVNPEPIAPTGNCKIIDGSRCRSVQPVLRWTNK